MLEFTEKSFKMLTICMFMLTDFMALFGSYGYVIAVSSYVSRSLNLCFLIYYINKV